MPETITRVAIAGANGRMGRQLIKAALNTPAVQLGAALVRAGSSLAGSDAGEFAGVGKCGVLLTDELSGLASQFDVMIDFTRPQYSLALLAFCCEQHKPLVTGTTGFESAGKAAIQTASARLPVVWSANFSIGVNVMLTLLDKASRVLAAHSDIEIIEAHHRHKIDAPSGTALAMGDTIAKAQGKTLADCAIYQREGIIGERPAGSIGFATVRAGDIVGEHTALFAASGERVEISHKASSRMTFAHGALHAAQWLTRQANGLYSMADVLDL